MKKRNGLQKEKVVMLASTALVLTALTVTGIYVRRGSEKSQDEGYTIDFSTLEKENEQEQVADSDLDYDPDATEAGSPSVENLYGSSEKKPADTGKKEADRKKEGTNVEKKTELAKTVSEKEAGDKAPEEELAETAKADPLAEGQDETAQAFSAEELSEQEMEAEDAMSAQIMPELNFSAESRLMMPLVGQVLINFSTDKSVYFPTLQLYKCNPALIIAAKQGTSVRAAANGMVSRVYQDAVTGNTVVMDLGNGYELTYGQLEDITVSEGSYLTEGQIFASIGNPTRYFTEEGSNLYMKLTKDNVAINPLQQANS